jgi:hypothetical protein
MIPAKRTFEGGAFIIGRHAREAYTRMANTGGQIIFDPSRPGTADITGPRIQPDDSV